ncbi:MAG TPA: heavy-metal-associated domain-containing protein [Geobacteraceae bacterium]
MAKRQWLNVVLVLAAVVVVGICAFSVRLEAAADRVAVLKTTGMTCGACAGRITTALKREKGVASVKVDVDGGRVIVGYDSKKVAPERIATSVTEAGYGSSILQVVSAVDYRRQTGSNPSRLEPSGGCACCATKRSEEGKKP